MIHVLSGPIGCTGAGHLLGRNEAGISNKKEIFAPRCKSESYLILATSSQPLSKEEASADRKIHTKGRRRV